MSRRNRKREIISVIEVLEARRLLAGDFFWRGTQDSNFSNDRNWEGGTAPSQPGDTAIFQLADTQSFNVALSAAVNIGSIVVTGGNFTLDLAGSGLTLSGADAFKTGKGDGSHSF